MYDIICVGSNAIDIFTNTELKEKSHKHQRFIAYPSGSKILIKDTKFTTGGGGTNTAVTFSRLGLNTGYLGKVGNDYFGNMVLEELKKEKIDFLGVRSKKKNSFSIVLDSKEHNRTILVFKGASSNLEFKEVKKSNLKTKWFYFSSQLKQSWQTQIKLVKFAKKQKIKVAFNPSQYLIKKQNIKPILKNIEILILNKDEAKLLTKKRDLLKELYAMGPKIVCITNGKKGITLYNGEYKYKLKPHKMKVKERTGAGDAFASTFVAAIIKNISIEEALKIALTNSESVIRYYGAKNRLLNWHKLTNKIKKDKFKIKKIKWN
ncbi:MAG: carbohydrate kinase family protein [Nanoarchaeota archaeon]|nr:carbohydrate kinase family protein [Nanoarchaeota archaeon]